MVARWAVKAGYRVMVKWYQTYQVLTKEQYRLLWRICCEEQDLKQVNGLTTCGHKVYISQREAVHSSHTSVLWEAYRSQGIHRGAEDTR